MSRNAEAFWSPNASSAPTSPALRKKVQSGSMPGGSAIDEVRKLVQRVFLIRENGNAPHAVAFCGASRGAGTTWVCARTGESLARESAANVCVIDANLGSPSLHTQFGVSNTAGLAEMVQVPRLATEFAQRISTNLSVITGGTVANQGTAALNMQALTRRVTELRGAFDFLLIDTPPMDASSDAVLFGRIADGIVLVVASDSTRRETARNVKDSFETARVPVLGAVLNKRTFPIPNAIYWKI